MYTPSLGRFKMNTLHWGVQYGHLINCNFHWKNQLKLYLCSSWIHLIDKNVNMYIQKYNPSLEQTQIIGTPSLGQTQIIGTPSLGQTQIFAPLHWGKIAKNRPFSAEHPRTPVDKKSPPRAITIIIKCATSHFSGLLKTENPINWPKIAIYRINIDFWEKWYISLER